MSVKKNINLVVVAHPDDEILGFGATGAKLTDQGHIVQPIILCGNVDVRTQRPSDEELYQDMVKANQQVGFDEPVLGEFPNIKMNTVPHVEIVQFIETQVERFQPTRIFTHHPNDLNDDHVQVSKACQAAARLFQRRDNLKPLESLYFMEILSSTEWSFSGASESFTPTVYTEVGDYIDTKISALRYYRNVMRKFPHPRSKEVLEGLAALRGAQSGYNYAEAFQLAFKRGI